MALPLGRGGLASGSGARGASRPFSASVALPEGQARVSWGTLSAPRVQPHPPHPLEMAAGPAVGPPIWGGEGRDKGSQAADHMWGS